jgi:hypothetical protein
MMALKRRLQDKDIAQEMISDIDSKDDISPPQSDSDTEDDNRTDALAETGPTLHKLDLPLL